MAQSEYGFDAEVIAEDIARWARIESPSFDPAAVNRMVDHTERAVERLGARVERIPGRDGRGDVLAARFGPDEGEPVLILGHLDTVHLTGTTSDSLPVRRDGDRLYGPGVQDMKGGLVLALHALDAVIQRHGQRGLRIPFTALFIPDEEIGSPSTRELIEREARASRCVLVPEPAHSGYLVTGRHGFARFTLRTRGQAAHAGRTGGSGRSAISAMAMLISAVESGSDPQRSISYRVGVVSGGDFVNVVPTRCEAQVLCVAPTDEGMREIGQRMAALRSPQPGVDLDVLTGPVRPVFNATPAGLDLFALARRVGLELGLELDPAQFGGGSDGNFTGALGIPTLDGLGVLGEGLHTKNEHLLVSELPRRAQLLAGLYEALIHRNAQ